MKGFKTLFWLELRRSGVWAVALIGSLAFWAWGLYQVRAVSADEAADPRRLLFGVAAAIGVLVLALMIGRLRGETRGGQYQVLLLTPASGVAHILSRFLFALGVSVVYYVALAGLGVWALRTAGVAVDPRSVAEIVLALPLYGIAVAVAPLLAWTLLLMVFVSAYRISGTGWIPGSVMVVGTPFALTWLMDGIVRVSYSLPTWAILAGMPCDERSFGTTYLMRPDGRQVLTSMNATHYLPQEPVWIMLALTAVLLLVASLIWREVEA